MAYLLFVDESGQDHRESPYEVLAGAAIHDSQIWPLVCEVQALEESIFGVRFSSSARELKARELLKRKTFRLASQSEAFPRGRRAALARLALELPQNVTRDQLTAVSQAKIDFAVEILKTCARHKVCFFGSIVEPHSPRPAGNLLRKDYAYLFERLFYFLDAKPPNERGLVVFDELERSRAHLLVDQMGRYFQRTVNGRMRVSRIIPEPLFVHSDLTTGIQVADLAAYLLSWNVRFGPARARTRSELDDLGNAVKNLGYQTRIDMPRYPDGFDVSSFVYINDLRPSGEKGLRDAG